MKYLLIALFILPSISYSQRDTAKQIIGKSYTMSGPYAYWVTVHLHKNKQAIVSLQTNGNSLQEIFAAVEEKRSKLGKDVVASYERITYQKSGSKKIELDVSAYNRDDTVPKSKARDEINGLKNFNFISGNIYFSGTGFTKNTAAKVSEKDKLRSYYDKSMSGTIITLENCVHQNLDGSLSYALNKSIKLN
jgi:lipopolysaccharide export LptBFGC system permease protein LptF